MQPLSGEKQSSHKHPLKNFIIKNYFGIKCAKKERKCSGVADTDDGFVSDQSGCAGAEKEGNPTHTTAAGRPLRPRGRRRTTNGTAGPGNGPLRQPAGGRPLPRPSLHRGEATGRAGVGARSAAGIAGTSACTKHTKWCWDVPPHTRSDQHTSELPADAVGTHTLKWGDLSPKVALANVSLERRTI